MLYVSCAHTVGPPYSWAWHLQIWLSMDAKPVAWRPQRTSQTQLEVAGENWKCLLIVSEKPSEEARRPHTTSKGCMRPPAKLLWCHTSLIPLWIQLSTQCVIRRRSWNGPSMDTPANCSSIHSQLSFIVGQPGWLCSGPSAGRVLGKLRFKFLLSSYLPSRNVFISWIKVSTDTIE